MVPACSARSVPAPCERITSCFLSVGERHPILRGSRQRPVPLFATAQLQELCPSRECRSRVAKSYPCSRLRARQEWQFFAVLPKADPVLATIWWALLILNGAMPAASRSPSAPPSTRSSWLRRWTVRLP